MNCRDLITEILMVDNLPETCKINHPVGNKHVVIVQLPAGFEYFHHPGRMPWFYFNSDHTASAPGFNFALYFIYKICFNVIAFFQGKISIAGNPEKVNGNNINISI